MKTDWNIVDPAHRAGRRVGRAAGTVGREIGAEIGHRLDIEREKFPLRVKREAGTGEIVAALCGGEKILAALGDPAHRPAEAARRVQHQDPFGIKKILGPEPAADIGGAYRDALGRHVEHGARQLVADRVDALAGQQQVERVRGRVIRADRGARLDRDDDEAVVDERDLDDISRRGECRLDRRLVATLEAIGQIAGGLVPHQRRAGGERRLRIDHGGQRAVRDRDSLGGVARLFDRLGDDERDRVADMPDAVARQRGTRRHDHRRDGRDLRDARQCPDSVCIEVGGGEDAAHPRHRSRRGRVDAVDQRVAVRRAQDDGVQLAWRGKILDVAPGSGQEPASSRRRSERPM